MKVKKRARICNNLQCDIYNKRINTATTICRNCQHPLVDAPQPVKKYLWVFLILAVLVAGSVAWWMYPNEVKTQVDNFRQFVAKYFPEKDTSMPLPSPTPPLPLSVQIKLDEILNRLNKLEQELVKNDPTNPSVNQIKELKEQLKQISDFLKRVGNTTDDITAKVSDLYDKLETSSPDVQTLQQTMTNVLQEMVKPEMDKLRAKLAQLQDSVNEYHTEIAKVNQKLAEGNLQATEIATMVAGLQVNNTKWEATLKEIKRIKETLPAKTELAEFKQRVESLELKVENVELKRTIDEMTQKSQDAEVRQKLEALANQMAKPTVVIIDLKELFGLETAKMRGCLTSLPPDFQRMLPMSWVNVQGQSVPNDLKAWMRDITDSTISESPFYIMRREVTIAEFGRYVNQLSSQQQEDLGNKWQKDNSGNLLSETRPVASVPWWAANGYAEWLSQQTQCDLALPTRHQWAAAAIQYANPKNAIVRQNPNDFSVIPQSRQDDESNVVLDLLGNLREWSIEECSDDGYYLLGEDYKTSREQIRGKPSCQMGSLRLDTSGFRLILKIETEHSPPSSPATSL
jgi:formylglycine-generating enzyme required for sulfatase activity